MVSTTLIVILNSVIVLVSGATWLKKLPEKPANFANQSGCYIKENDAVIGFGEETAQNDACISIVCGKRYIEYVSCALVSAEPPCYITNEKPGKPYPQCCPDIKCEDENNIS